MAAPVTLSVLDRLIDHEPAVSFEAPLSRAESVRRLKASVRRDLEWLLNIRRIAEPPPAELIQVQRSLCTIGLDDFSGFGYDGPRLLRHIQDVIQQFEPRLAQVRIEQQDQDARQRAVRFRIEANLLMDPAPERVSFDTVLELASGQYAVREDA